MRQRQTVERQTQRETETELEREREGNRLAGKGNSFYFDVKVLSTTQGHLGTKIKSGKA